MTLLNKVICGDCLELLKQIPNNSIHCVITDIPYGISFSEWDVKHNNTNSALLGSSPAQTDNAVFKTRGKPKNGWSKEDRNIPLEFQKFCESFLLELTRILYPAGSILAFTGRQFQHRYMIACENSGLIIKDTLAWNKIRAPFRAQSIGQVIGKRNGDFSDKQRLGNLAPIFEPIVWAFKPYQIGGTLTDCYLNYGTGTFSDSRIKNNFIQFSSLINNRQHETEKPVGLLEILVETFTLKGQIILDCFAGSGTTGVACQNLNRQYILIEKEEKYVEIIKKRLCISTEISKK